MTKYLPTVFFCIGTISMIIMSLHYFQFEITGILKGKAISQNFAYRSCLKVHILFGILAIAVGPFQFLESLRTRYVRIHKRLGYIYVISIFISSICGLIVAQFAMGGIVSVLGFSTLAILWFTTTLLATKAAIAKKFNKHKLWMYFSYAFTFSAIPQRTLLLLAFLPDVSFLSAYRLSAWMSWILNVLIAYYLYTNSRQKEKIS